MPALASTLAGTLVLGAAVAGGLPHVTDALKRACGDLQGTACDWALRDHLSLDFLTCEPGKWIGPHATNPMLFYLAFNDVTAAFAVTLAFEAFEVTVKSFVGDFTLLFVDPGDMETLAASLVGDAVIQGGLGITIGYCVRAVFLLPTLASSAERARAGGTLAKRRRATYLVAYAALTTSYLLCGRQVEGGGLRYGLLVQTGILCVGVLVAYGVWFQTPDDVQLIWVRRDGTRLESWRMWGALWTIVAFILVAHLPHVPGDAAQPLFTTSEWYMQWILSGLFAGVLWVAALATACARTDLGEATTLVSVGLLWGGLVVWVAGSSTDAAGYIGSVLLVLGTVGVVVSEAADWPHPTVPGAPASSWRAAVSETVYTSRTAVAYPKQVRASTSFPR